MMKRLLFWLIVISTASGDYYAQMSAPRLECASDGIRLHLQPSGTFGGHVYVRGFFPQSVCHLNYCTNLTNKPITMNLPFRGPCNVRRRRNVTPPSISYDVTVIIQHHPLFVTSFDKSYRLNCIYRQLEANVHQKLNVSEISSTSLNSNSAPKCRYDVLSGSINGPIVRFANVGDVVVHKWTCDSDRFGFVVHSCSVRDESGKDYQFVDERGCVTDSTLFPEITYSANLQSAFTAVRAFRYADQVLVHFSCQITTCRRFENGCEGISPPICRPLDLGPIKVLYADRGEKRPEILPTRAENENISTSTSENLHRDQPKYEYPNLEPEEGVGQDNSADVGARISESTTTPEYGLEISRYEPRAPRRPLVAEPETLPAKEVFHVETISKTIESSMEPLPYPTKASIYQHRSPRSHKTGTEDTNITLEVETSKMVILEHESVSDEVKKCADPEKFPTTMLLITLSVMQVISMMTIITQRMLYKKRIDKLTGFEDRTTSRRF